MATVSLPTWVVAITLKGMSGDEIARRLRLTKIPIFGRIKDQKFLLDGRTIRDDEGEFVLNGFKSIMI